MTTPDVLCYLMLTHADGVFDGVGTGFFDPNCLGDVLRRYPVVMLSGDLDAVPNPPTDDMDFVPRFQ